MADKLKGIWVFDKVTYDNSSASAGYKEVTWNLNFTANGVNYSSLLIGCNDFKTENYDTTSTKVIKYDNSSKYQYATGWANVDEAEKIIEIHSTYDEVENAATLVRALTARATFTPYGTDIQIPMATAKGVLLKTAGKYCENDIAVTPELEELTATENREYISSKVGYSKVIVNVRAEGGDIPEISEPLTLTASKEGAEEGELVVAYSLSEKVALPTGTNKPLGFLQDANYVPSNIKKDVYLFGLKGEYEGESSGGGDDLTKYFEEQHTEVTLPNVTKLKPYAFYYDSVLTNISMPKVTSIGSSAFKSCSSLAPTSLPSGLTSIGDNAFQSCSSLALTSLPSGLTSIGNFAFSGCAKLALTSLPSGLTTIAGQAFQSCSSLALTSLPDGITSIGNYAFQYCSSLALTSLPSGLTTIGSSAFQSCSSLALTSLPSSIRTIAGNAFSKCTNLKSITFKGTPSSIATNAFSDCSNLTTINVPWAEGEVEKAPWGASNATINYNYTGE